MATNGNQSSNSISPQSGRTAGEKGGRAGGPARIISLVVIGLLAVAAIALFSQTRSQSRKLQDEAASRLTAEERAGDLERNLADRIREVSDLADQLRFAEAGQRQLQDEVSELQTGRGQMQSRLEGLQSRNTILEERLQAEQTTLGELQVAFRESREAQKRYLDQIEKLLEDKNALQDRISQTRPVEMPGLLVKENRPAIAPLRGTILKVNLDYDFVVFNRGSSDGVVSGVRFRVLDGDREVGEVTASRVLPDMTVADINRAQTHRQLQTGLTVLLYE